MLEDAQPASILAIQQNTQGTPGAQETNNATDLSPRAWFAGIPRGAISTSRAGNTGGPRVPDIGTKRLRDNGIGPKLKADIDPWLSSRKNYPCLATARSISDLHEGRRLSLSGCRSGRCRRWLLVTGAPSLGFSLGDVKCEVVGSDSKNGTSWQVHKIRLARSYPLLRIEAQVASFAATSFPVPFNVSSKWKLPNTATPPVSNTEIIVSELRSSILRLHWTLTATFMPAILPLRIFMGA